MVVNQREALATITEIRAASADFQYAQDNKKAQELVKQYYPENVVLSLPHLKSIIVSVVRNGRSMRTTRVMAMHEMVRRFCVDYNLIVLDSFGEDVLETLRRTLGEASTSNAPKGSAGDGSYKSLFKGDWKTDYYTVTPDSE